jgi:uncharacterized membrane protein (UPF0127 family)
VLRALAVCFLVALTSCERSRQPQQAQASTDAPRKAEPPQQRHAPDGAQREAPRVVVIDPEGREYIVDVEIARTPEERRVGLMYRRHLPPNAGMLFLFDRDEIHSFWMKNTLIPLDMIFIRADLTIAGVLANVPPLTEQGRSIGKPSRHVLEVNAGWAARHGIGAGARVRFENTPGEDER